MDQRTLWVYQSELRLQCEIALRALGGVWPALQDLHAAPPDIRPAELRLWTSLHTFLNACANISKLLWPSPARDSKFREFTLARAEALRNSLGITSPNALENRALRNSFEHFDERLDEWASRPGPHGIVMRSTFSANSVVGISAQDCVATLDPDTGEVTFLGKPTPIQPLYEAVKEVHAKVIAATTT